MGEDNMDGKKDKEDKDMAIRTNDVKANLADLKERAAKRKNNIQPSKEYIKELDERAKVLYEEQNKTIK